MGYNTAAADWPQHATVSAQNKACIDTFLNLLDTNNAEVGDRLADEIFAKNGILIGPSGTIQGSEALRKCRDNAWGIVTKRRHKVLRVYAHDAQALDLMIIAESTNGLKNGKNISGEFVARLTFSPDADCNGVHKIKLYQVYADFGLMHKQIAEALKSES